MNTLSVLGKYLDQPMLIGKFSRAVPFILVGGGAACTYGRVNKAPEKEKRKEFIKSIAVLAGTISAALIAPKIARKIIKYHGNVHIHCDCHEHGHEHGHEIGNLSLSELKEKNTELIEEFLKNNKVTEKTLEYLNKAKEKVLKFSEIKTIFNELRENPKAKEFLTGDDGLIPDPENIDSKHIFSEIGRISILGLMPVLGGITGGIIGDKLTEKDWKERISNKIKEGSYQYLANIFLCNIGAGAALAIMEKLNIKQKSARLVGMLSGIILTGLVLGSAAANLIGKKLIDPLLKHKHNHGKLYDERKPEILDVSLHIDDVSTVAVLSGLKWIEPALPILYSISGYRAGIGYRNGEE